MKTRRRTVVSATHERLALKGPSFDVKDFIPRLTSSLTVHLHGVMTEALLPYTINIAEWRVILCLHDGRTCTLNELVDMTGLNQSSLSRVAVRVEKKGLVTRARRASDARLMNIRITARGEKLYHAATAAVQVACDRELAILTRQEREIFVRSAKKLLASLPPPVRPSGFQY